MAEAPLSSQIIGHLLDVSNIASPDKSYMKETLEDSCITEHDDDLARRVLGSMISYYERQDNNLTLLEARVVNGLLARFKNSPAPIHGSSESQIINVPAINDASMQLVSLPHSNGTHDASLNSYTTGGVPMKALLTPWVDTCDNTEIEYPSTPAASSVVSANLQGRSAEIEEGMAHLTLSGSVDVSGSIEDAIGGPRTSSHLYQHFVPAKILQSPEESSKKRSSIMYTNSSFTPTSTYEKNYRLGSKLMMKSGWKPGDGLGPMGRGIKEPIDCADQPLKNVIEESPGLGHISRRAHAPVIEYKGPRGNGNRMGGAKEHDVIDERAREAQLRWNNMSTYPQAHDQLLREKAFGESCRTSGQQGIVLRSIEDILTKKQSAGQVKVKSGSSSPIFAVIEDPYGRNSSKDKKYSNYFHNGW
ncbi:hypothetical protein BJ170DRAFT_734442 [Xylariales sp. AK1849]|nr:hypothetical protein BJ170DRAFT_734442 [Xylariales sp. AK1849]